MAKWTQGKTVERRPQYNWESWYILHCTHTVIWSCLARMHPKLSDSIETTIGNTLNDGPDYWHAQYYAQRCISHCPNKPIKLIDSNFSEWISAAIFTIQIGAREEQKLPARVCYLTTTKQLNKEIMAPIICACSRYFLGAEAPRSLSSLPLALSANE